MARQPRLDVPNLLLHVINRGNGRQPIFRSKADREEYLELIERFKERHAVRLYNYVLMTNHVHFLIESLEEGALAGFMHDLTLAHTVRFNQRNHTVGHLWQGRYKAIPIDRDAYFLQCGRYIELNPVRAKMVRHPSEYPWSSYVAYANGEPSRIIDPHPLYNDLGGTSAIRQRRYRSDMERELVTTQVKEGTRFSEQQIYGSPKFIAKLKRDYGFTILHSRPGRPKNGT